MRRREKAELAATLWAAMEECEPMADAVKDAEGRRPEDYRVKLTIGEFEPPNWDGTHTASLVLDLTTGKLIMAAAERIIRERLVEIGEMDKSELAATPAFTINT